MAKKRHKNYKGLRPGTTRTVKITRGPNKGDTHLMRVGPSGKPYPVRIVKDVGRKSTFPKSAVKRGKSAPKKRKR